MAIGALLSRARSKNLRRACAQHAASTIGPGLRRGLVEPVEAGIGVGLHQPGVAGQMLLGMLAAAIGRVEEDRRRRIGARRTAGRRAHRSTAARCGVLPLASTGTVVSSAWMRSAANTWARIASTSGIRVAAAGADPVGQRRDVELDALAGIGRALAVERQMQAVLGEQHMRQQPRPGASARDRMRRRRRLGDRLAAPAGELLAHMLDHLPLARHQLQRLGHVLAELVQRAAAARAGRGRRIDHALARQMLGQRPARRLAPRRRPARPALVRLGDLRRRLGLGLRPPPARQLQLELVEQRAALRRLAEPLVPQLGDRGA